MHYRLFSFALLSMVGLLFSGCQTPGTATTTVYEGQLRYSTDSDAALIGEVVVVSGEPFKLEFMKGPGSPLLRVSQNGMFASVSGSLAGPGWSGRADQAPEKLQSWLALRGVFNGPDTPAIRNINQPSFRVKRDVVDGVLLGVEVQFLGTGETFQFRFD